MEYKEIFSEYVLNTSPGAKVFLYDAFICSIPPDVYISTKSLKHVYDRRPDVTRKYLDRIYDVFEYPDCITQGGEDQRGDILFLKKLSEDKFLICPAEFCKKEGKSVLFCVTFFPAGKAYIKKSTILWSREVGGIPPIVIRFLAKPYPQQSRISDFLPHEIMDHSQYKDRQISVKFILIIF